MYKNLRIFFYLGPSLLGPSFYKKMFYLWFMRFINLNSDPLKILGPRLKQDRTIQNAFDFFFLQKMRFIRMGYETSYPEPRTPEPLTEIAELSHSTTWAWKLINLLSKEA